MLLRNPSSYDTSRFINAEKWTGDIDENGAAVEGTGRWIPNTSVPGQEKYDKLLNGDFGQIEITPPPRDVSGKLAQVMAQGVQWVDSNSTDYSLKVDDLDARERIASASIRLQINNTLPKNKTHFDYPDINNILVPIPKEDVQDVAMLIQDFVEDCYDNYNRLVSDSSLDVDSGWPS